MADAAPAALGVYKPRRPQAAPLFRLVQDFLHRLQTVYDERFVRDYGPWRPVVAQVADTFLASGIPQQRPSACASGRSAYRTGCNATAAPTGSVAGDATGSPKVSARPT